MYLHKSKWCNKNEFLHYKAFLDTDTNRQQLLCDHKIKGKALWTSSFTSFGEQRRNNVICKVLTYECDDKPVNGNNYGTHNGRQKHAKSLGFKSALQSSFQRFKILTLITDVFYLIWMYVKKETHHMWVTSMIWHKNKNKSIHILYTVYVQII